MIEPAAPLHLRKQLSDAEIVLRRELHGLNDALLAQLATYRGLMSREVDGVIQAFYQHQLTVPEVAGVIGDESVLQRLHDFMRRYVLDLFDGRCDRPYVDNRLRIGQRHQKLGIAPKLYLAAMRKLRELLIAVLEDHLATTPEILEASRQALGRLMNFDSALVMDTYIDSLLHEVESARQQLEEYAGSLERKVARRTAQLEELTRRDPLTDLYNPRALRELLQRELSHSKRRRRPLTLAFFDIDDFKQVNDSRGHQGGDDVLSGFGRILHEVCREEDIPCRYGGDEFCVVVVDSDLDAAEVFCRRVIERFGLECPDISFSVGLAQAGPVTFDSVDGLIEAADRNMYEAKQAPGFQIRRLRSLENKE